MNPEKFLASPTLKSPLSWIVFGAILWVLLVVAFPVVLRYPCATEILCLGVTASEESIRQAMLWSLGGIIATASLWFTYKKHRLDQDADWTRRYAEAVAQIGDEKESTRVGGIYALERIARDAPRDRDMILRVLASFIRHPPKMDIIAAPDSIESRMSPAVTASIEVLVALTKIAPPPEELDLSGADLRHAKLSGGNFTGVLFKGTILSNANLTGATLQSAFFESAILDYAKLTGADARKANLYRASLRYTLLKRADMSETILFGANLQGTVFFRTRLEGALFFRIRVKQASATGWNPKGLQSAGSWDEKTIWPKGFIPTDSIKLFDDEIDKNSSDY